MTSDEYERSKPVMEIKTKILATRLRAGHCTKDVLFEAADRLDALLEDLKMVLAREAKTQARHDNKLDAQDDEKADWQSETMHQNALLHDALTRAEVAEAKLANASDALKEILFLSNEDDVGGWLDALARAQALMTELENAK